MRTVINAVLIVLLLDVILFLSQIAMVEINPGASQFFNYEGSNMQSFDSSGGNYVLDQDVSDDLPNPGNPVAVSLGSNVFTDIFSTMKNWVLEIPGFRYVLMTVNAVPNYLKYFNLPNEISFALGYLWHGITFVLVLIFIKD